VNRLITQEGLPLLFDCAKVIHERTRGKNMKKIFIGLIFIFFNFNITLGTSILPLLPDFIGYLLISLGAKEMIDASAKFDNVSAFSKLLTFVFGVFFVMDVMGISASMAQMTLFNWLFGLAVMVIELYLLYLLTMAVLELKPRLSYPSEADRLYQIFKYHAISAAVASLFIIILPILGIIAMIITVFFAILYIVIFNRIKNDPHLV
jgi:hypothetical protein